MTRTGLSGYYSKAFASIHEGTLAVDRTNAVFNCTSPYDFDIQLASTSKFKYDSSADTIIISTANIDLNSSGNLDIIGDFTAATITMTGFTVSALGATAAVSLDCASIFSAAASLIVDAASGDLILDAYGTLYLKTDNLGGALVERFYISGGVDLAAITFNDVSTLVMSTTAVSGVTTIACAGTITNTAGDFTIYENANNSDPYISLGTSATESLKILTTCAASSKTLQEVEFITATASATADYGRYIFDVDGTDILVIDDGGIEVTGAITATGAISGVTSIDGSTDLTMGTITMVGFSVGATGIANVLSLNVGGTEVIDTSRKLSSFQGYSGTLPDRSDTLNVASAIRPTTNAPELYKKDGTNHSWNELRYDDTTDEKAYWHFVAPDNISNTNDVVIRLTWIPTSTAAGDVHWSVGTAAVTEGNAWNATPLTASVTDTSGGNSANTNECTISAGKWTAGQPIILLIMRLAGSLDTMAGDAGLVMIEREYKITE